ncbi:type I methionyl aminopeptidase [soil metagenome]
MVTLKSLADVSKMREAGKVVSRMLAATRAAARPGASTADLDRVAEEVITASGATSSFLGYHGYPATICTSINDEVVHGIPSRKRRLRDGEIIGIDVGAIVDGWPADAATTVAVGSPTDQAAGLIEVTAEALRRGIAAARVGARIGDIGAAVQAHVEGQGYAIVRNYVGHGIGRAMHEEPQVPNYGPGDRGLLIREGICLAIEPMVNLGGAETRVLPDLWTVVTADGSLSAHFEHTIWCGVSGPVVLTAPGEEPDSRIRAELEGARLVKA